MLSTKNYVIPGLKKKYLNSQSFETICHTYIHLLVIKRLRAIDRSWDTTSFRETHYPRHVGVRSCLLHLAQILLLIPTSPWLQS